MTQSLVPFIAAMTLWDAAGTSLTASKLQTAVDKVLGWTRKGGRVEVVGVQEIPNEKSARPDIRFEAFQYNSDHMGRQFPTRKNYPRSRR